MTLPTRRADNRPVAGRWDPSQEIEETWTRMARLLGDVAGGTGSRSFAPWLLADLPVDVEETDDAFVVELDLPGVPREDLSIELRDDELHVTGEIEERQRSGVLRRQNRRTGRLEYRILLPGEVNPDAVEAALTDGVLTVQLGKTQPAASYRCQVLRLRKCPSPPPRGRRRSAPGRHDRFGSSRLPHRALGAGSGCAPSTGDVTAARVARRRRTRPRRCPCRRRVRWHRRTSGKPADRRWPCTDPRPATVPTRRTKVIK